MGDLEHVGKIKDMKTHQMYDTLWEEVSSKVIADKTRGKESDGYKHFSLKPW